MTEFDDDFDWQAQFRDHYAEIARNAVRVDVSSWDDDIRRNTDFVVATLGNGFRVACRARRAEYRARYHGDFTIRYARPSGVPTEWHKLRDGWGDFIIYGFDIGFGRLQPWVMLNAHLVREYLTNGGRWLLGRNEDGTQFAALEVDKLPIGAVLNAEGHSRGGFYLGPPEGPCRYCGGLVFNIVDVDGVWTHPCCERAAPARCRYCSNDSYRFGWEGRFAA